MLPPAGRVLDQEPISEILEQGNWQAKTTIFCICSNIWPLARPNIAGEGSGLLKTYWARRLCWPAARKLRNSGHPKS